MGEPSLPGWVFLCKMSELSGFNSRAGELKVCGCHDGLVLMSVNKKGGSLSNELKVRVMPASVGIWLIVLAVTLRA